MTKIKEFFLGQLSDSLNTKLISTIQDKRRQKEISQASKRADAAEQVVRDSLSKSPETNEQDLPTSIPETAGAKEVVDRIVGE
ncbi:MAG: hypothetical protein GX559_01080 [Candidatus Pacebacteria bacterium]|nr:hypothetical protein [Candidatus Paceibacterota bacterium]